MKESAMTIGSSGKGGRASPLARRLRIVLAAMVVIGCVAWSLDAMDERTRERQALLDISRIGHAARLFRADFGRCPADVGELAAPPEGVPYLGRVEDPWGRPYRMTCPSRRDPGGVDVISLGRDGGKGKGRIISSL